MWFAVVPKACVPSWQLLQLVTACWVWFQVLGLKVDCVAEWQLAQFSAVTMWLTLVPSAVVPLWQVVQSVAAVYSAWFGLAVKNQVPGLWQFSQLLDAEAWVGLDGLPVNPYPVVRWQLEHCVVTVTLLWNRPGFQRA